ncbi:hypothetical protein SprV_0401538800 [Sparganum proliferum]
MGTKRNCLTDHSVEHRPCRSRAIFSNCTDIMKTLALGGLPRENVCALFYRAENKHSFKINLLVNVRRNTELSFTAALMWVFRPSLKLPQMPALSLSSAMIEMSPENTKLPDA